MNVHDKAVNMVKRLQKAGYIAVFTGGVVRDSLLGLTPTDYDIATSALPTDVMKLFPHNISDGVLQGVVKVIDDHDVIDIATLRLDGSYSDGRRPDSVEFTKELFLDSCRRDFTINAIYFDPVSELYYDYHDGRTHLEQKILKCVGFPDDRYKEDSLRILRAFRFAYRFGLQLQYVGIAGNIELLDNLSGERVRDELFKIFALPAAPDAVRKLEEYGVLWQIFPSVEIDLHAFKTLHYGNASPELLLAGLLNNNGDDPALYEACVRLKLSNKQREFFFDVLDKQKSVALGSAHTRASLLNLLRNDNLNSIAALYDSIFLDGTPVCKLPLTQFYRDRYKDLIAIINAPTLLNGNDLIDLGIAPGPTFKYILNCVRGQQDEGVIVTRQEAIDYIRCFHMDGI